MNSASDIGSIGWSLRTGGRLDAAERRRLIADLVGVHVGNVTGRLSVLVHLNSGRHATLSPERLLPPDSALTFAAEDVAIQHLPVTLLNHSYRTYTFGMALGELEQLDVDAELLFAAAMLHDTGLTIASGHDDFTVTSARLAFEVAERVGLSTSATETLQTAITMHHNPRVTHSTGTVSYLLSAGAGVDVAGLRSWELPSETMASAVREHPREAFKKYFARAWKEEAGRVPKGRARLLRRYGAFTAAIRLAPFHE